MAKKLYVGNLSYQMTDDSLRDVFAAVGEVLSSKVVADPGTGRSRGFGFVEMANDEDADKAIAALNGKNVMDRELNVSEARPQKDRGSAGGGRAGGFDRSGGGGKGRKQNNW
jgi:RNA recognition motif-containing protein